MRLSFFALFLLSVVCRAADQHYLGRDVCAGCHADIAKTQAQTAMARTWQGITPQPFPVNRSEQHSEGADPAISYLIRRTAEGLSYQVHLPEAQPLTMPIEKTMGGQRHGLSFLARLGSLDGLLLPRTPLIETRYLHYNPSNNLALSPGFDKEKPTTYETALGRVLTPNFEKKCLTCHGEPRTVGTHMETGVTCENCHGPGRSHLDALGKKSTQKGILNPAKFPVSEQMQPCSQCHAGFSKIQDPLPNDLLISDQVTALSNSECWRQSSGQITCVNCHNPHQDAPQAVLVARSEKTCLQCHSETMSNHAAICPVNRASGCVGCHMPESRSSTPFVIADHWIRVHSDLGIAKQSTSPAQRTQVTPKHLYLRMMVTDNAEKANAMKSQLLSGGSFFEIARANSTDQLSAISGGYLGDLEASKLDPAWRAMALRLQPGEVSDVIPTANRYFLLQRMPRNFREEADEHFKRAMDLRKEGDRQKSSVELLEALKIYPYFLRALTYLGVTDGEAGNPQTAAAILKLALQLYPEDAGSHFNLGIAYGAMGKQEEEVAEYKRVLEIEPDYVPAYLNWGAALVAADRYSEAIGIYRQGIAVNPLVATLHYSLSIALEHEGKSSEAKSELALSSKIDPKVGRR
jgi:predicted CXXCH cytochrome family protein